MDEFGTSIPRDVLGLRTLGDVYVGAIVERGVYALAELGVADVIHQSGPMTVSDIAAAVGCLPDPLFRVMRLLAARGVFEEVEPGCFANTTASDCLRSDVPWSFRWTFLASGSDQACTEILHVLRTGQSGYERATGHTFWHDLDQDRRRVDQFMAQMRCEARTTSMPLVARYDFSEAELVVDVGGGQGHVLAGALRSAPHLRGILFDQPAMTEKALDTLERAAVANRCEVVSGDFFEAVPEGGDVYILSRVLHDWDDESCLRILRSIRSSIRDDGRLLVLEMTQDGARLPTLASDVLMLVVFGEGGERFAHEFVTLLEQASFEVLSISETPFPVQLIEARPS